MGDKVKPQEALRWDLSNEILKRHREPNRGSGGLRMRLGASQATIYTKA